MLGPAGLPEHVVDRLHPEMREALAEPVLIDRLRGLGAKPHLMNPAAFKSHLIEDITRWMDVVAEAKIEKI